MLGINIGILVSIVKLPEEVCASHTKRVGLNKKVYYTSSSQKCCSLDNPFKNFIQNVVVIVFFYFVKFLFSNFLMFSILFFVIVIFSFVIFQFYSVLDRGP